MFEENLAHLTPYQMCTDKKIKYTFFLHKQQKIYAKIGVYFQKALK